ncbi:Small GTP-binding [Micractinium conductrix]|uniref:Small GTP-binding n=1 Tax=Micractinium conductrix TaxID=554055 RepID=A0A2P6VE30_9CHLO|nr:Small GTP-binding [Micractinium conductrix]|eukprot:PSC72329.1 Small GTP-binding [Micractinium conductrix]
MNHSTGLGDLPDPLLGRILVLLDSQASKRAATLTCKRFRDVIYSEPALWDTVSLQCDAYVDSGLCHYGLGARRRRWLEGKRALLSRVGGLLWRLQLSDRAAVECTVPEPSGLRHPESPGGPGSHAPPPRHPWLFSELLPLAGPQLQSLHLQLGGQSRGEGYARRNEQYPLQPLPAEVAASLPRLFPQLAHLKLRVLSLPACAPGVLRQLPCLSKLQLDVQEALPEGVVPALEAATALTSLRLASSQAPLPPVQGLAASMRHLRHLRLHDGGHRQSGLALPPPASFPELQSYHFKGAAHTSLQVGGGTLQECWCGTRGDSAGSLTLKLPGAPALAPLLAALLPAGVQLEALHTSGGGLTPKALRRCAALSALHTLGLEGVSPDGLVALVQQAPQLTRLYCINEGCYFGMGSVPAEVVALRQLQDLALSYCELRHLPEGPYLTGLQRLSLEDNQFTTLPPALATATALTRLALSGNSELRASDAELCQALLPMAGLQALGVCETSIDRDEVLLYLWKVPRGQRALLRVERGEEIMRCCSDDSSTDGYGDGGYDSSDSDSDGDGCPRYSWGGCAYAADWY